MSEGIKYIITQLNKSPYLKNYNLISFDSLNPEDLLQVLSDVICEINKETKIDIRTEEPEQTTVRLLSMLRVLKYNPGSNPIYFRQGIVQGEKHIIHPILEWLLRNAKELAKRAYLAQYLVKLEIPLEMMGDADIGSLNEFYEKLIEDFKVIHKESELVSAQSSSTSELRADLEAMEKEKEIVLKKIDRISRKIEVLDSSNEILAAAHKLRVERERQKELNQQRQDELNNIQELQQKATRISQHLKELRQSSHDTTSDGLLKNLEEELKIKQYIATEKLPKEIEARKREFEVYSRIAIGLPPSQQDLEEVALKLQKVSDEVNQLVQRNLAEIEPSEDKLAPFRQQATIIERKKEEMADKYSQAKAELAAILSQIKEKEGGMRPLSESEYKEYVNKLKVKSTLYKAKKAQQAALVTESAVLLRTKDILTNMLEKLKFQASSNRFEMEDEEELEARSKEELVHKVNELNVKLVTQKNSLSGPMQELKSLKSKENELIDEYQMLKTQYDSKAAIFESECAKIEQEVNEIKKEQQADLTEISIMEAKAGIAAVLLDRAKREFNDNGIGDGKRTSLRVELGTRISELEKTNKDLKENQKQAKETQEKNSKQRDVWTTLITLLECKQECVEKAKKNDGIVRREKGAETLVLQ